MAYQEEPNQQQQFYPQEGMVQQNGYEDQEEGYQNFENEQYQSHTQLNQQE